MLGWGDAGSRGPRESLRSWKKPHSNSDWARRESSVGIVSSLVPVLLHAKDSPLTHRKFPSVTETILQFEYNHRMPGEKFDPRDLISPPWKTCPACGKNKFGICIISGSRLMRRCRD